ncbi:hypothetical protein [Clostridium butyricum]
MGFFGWVGSKISSAVSYVKEKVTEAKDYIKQKTTNVWNTFTGKKTADEAKEIYDDAISSYNKAKRDFDDFLEKRSREINNSVQKINEYKKLVFSKQLKEVIQITSKLHNFSMTSKEMLENEFKYGFDELKIKSYSNVMKIDFDNNKFKTSVQAIFTLGFYTRKKAKESLSEANDVANSVRLKIEQMYAEKVRIDSIRKSISNVEYYFANIIEMMDRVLPKLENSISMLRNLHLVFSYSFFKGKLDYNKLPKVQKNYFEASVTMSKILVEMSKNQYLSSDNSVIENDMKSSQSANEKAEELIYKIGA